MKKIILFIIPVFCSVMMIAQNHPCAESKIYNYQNRTQPTHSSQRQNRTLATVSPLENNYDLKFYHLNVNVDRDTNYISGNVLCKAAVIVANLDTFAFLLHQNLIIDSVYVNGFKKTFIRKDSLVKTVTDNLIPQNQLFEAIVYYKGYAPFYKNATLGNGLNTGKSPSWSNHVTWSLSEPLVAYHWFPCKQNLRDKIDSSWVFATTDSSNMVGSNGILRNVSKIGSKKRYEWKSNYPIAYYLISVAVAKYKEYNLYAKPLYLKNDSILIQNYIYDGAINNPKWINNQKITLNKIVQTLELECKLFGMYPFYKEKYGHCMAPLNGGMEHQTMTSIGAFDFSIDAHELGHQWWGDNVTCDTWKDIFINEAWASYAAYLCDEYLPSISGQTATKNMFDAHKSVMSQIGGSSYFTNADTLNPNVIFSSRLTYNKGSAIIHALRYTINNDSVFFPAIRSFQKTYGGKTASVIDFKKFMANYTEINFDQFFNQWFYGQGYPIFNILWNQSQNIFSLKSTQITSFPSSVPLFITNVDYRISRTGMADTIVRLFHGQSIENYTIALSGTVTSIATDPNNWILNKDSINMKDITLNTIQQNEKSAFVFVGPNPTSNALNIYLYDNGHATLEMFDIAGKLVLTQNFNTHLALDISSFANGIYNVSIKNNKGESIKNTKVVKT